MLLNISYRKKETTLRPPLGYCRMKDNWFGGGGAEEMAVGFCSSGVAQLSNAGFAAETTLSESGTKIRCLKTKCVCGGEARPQLLNHQQSSAVRSWSRTLLA